MGLVNELVDCFLESDKGVIGNGIAKSLSVRFPEIVRGFVGEEKRRVGDGGGSRTLEGDDRDFGDFGDREVKRCVSADCLGVLTARGGRLASGTWGTTCFFSCSYCSNIFGQNGILVILIRSLSSHLCPATNFSR